MAVDIPIAQDLTFIFERDDVKDAFAGHCARTHDDVEDTRHCSYCTGLRLALATAIVEWKAMCDQQQAADAVDPVGPAARHSLSTRDRNVLPDPPTEPEA